MQTRKWYEVEVPLIVIQVRILSSVMKKLLDVLGYCLQLLSNIANRKLAKYTVNTWPRDACFLFICLLIRLIYKPCRIADNQDKIVSRITSK